MRHYSVRVFWPHASYQLGPYEATDRLDAIEQAKAQLRREQNLDMLRWSFSAWLAW